MLLRTHHRFFVILSVLFFPFVIAEFVAESNQTQNANSSRVLLRRGKTATRDLQPDTFANEVYDDTVIEFMMFRITVMQDVQAAVNGFGKVGFGFDFSQTVAIAIINLRETFEIYDITLPENVITTYATDIATGNLFISLENFRITENTVVYDINRSTLTILPENPIPPAPVPDMGLPYQDGNLAKYNRLVVVLRVSGESGAPVVYTTEELRRGLFDEDANNNGVSMKSQFFACSNERLQMNLADDKVYDITVPGSVANYASPAAMRNKALEIFTAQMKTNGRIPATGNLRDVFDHIMVVLPQNSWPNFIGTASTNGGVSTLNNAWTLDVTVYMHELAHNLNVGHGFIVIGDTRVWDYTSVMGATGWEPRLKGPLQCFNGAANRELGWWGDRTFDVTIDTPQTAMFVTLAAFSEAAKKKNKDDPILLTVGPYSLQYNYATEFNAGTEMLRDVVTVSYSEPGINLVQENGLAPSDGELQINNFAQSGHRLRVAACNRVDATNKNPSSMVMAVSLGIDGQSPCAAARNQENDPTPMPTKPRTVSPTALPTSSPTTKPTGKPTNLPTSTPTTSPTAKPTNAPTTLPTSAPTLLPTALPTTVPTPRRRPSSKQPTSSPTNLPTLSPTDQPRAKRTEKPSISPTRRRPPTDRPTKIPTPVPTAAPFSFNQDGDARTERIDFFENESVEKMSVWVLLAAFNSEEDSDSPILLQVGPYSLRYEYIPAPDSFRLGDPIGRSSVSLTLTDPNNNVFSRFEEVTLFPGRDYFTAKNFEGSKKALRIAACAEYEENGIFYPHIMTIALSLSIRGSPCDIAPETTTEATTVATTTQATTPATTTTTTTTIDDNKTRCPHTSRIRVKYLKDANRNKYKSIKCKSINRKGDTREFCAKPTGEAGQTVGDVCLNECAEFTNICIPR